MTSGISTQRMKWRDARGKVGKAGEPDFTKINHGKACELNSKWVGSH